jgi:hypothetical protein
MAILGQLAFYSCALLGWLLKGTRLGHKKVFTIPFYFCMVNIASLVAFINVLQGHQVKLWEPQRPGQTPYENAHKSARTL